MTITPIEIEKLYQKVCKSCLCGKDKCFIESLYQQSLKHSFNGLSPKQASWFKAIEKNIKARDGLLGCQIIASQHTERWKHYRRAYAAACVGW